MVKPSSNSPRNLRPANGVERFLIPSVYKILHRKFPTSCGITGQKEGKQRCESATIRRGIRGKREKEKEREKGGKGEGRKKE